MKKRGKKERKGMTAPRCGGENVARGRDIWENRVCRTLSRATHGEVGGEGASQTKRQEGKG